MRFPLALLSTVLVLAAGCGKPNYVLAPERQVSPADWPASRLTPHVLVVSIDGLRPDAITTFNAPTLRRLTVEGSYTLAASTITPSKTLPSHTSMLTGLSPEQHGVLWNTAATAKTESDRQAHRVRPRARPRLSDGRVLQQVEVPAAAAARHARLLAGAWRMVRTLEQRADGERRRNVPRDRESESSVRASRRRGSRRSCVRMDEPAVRAGRRGR